MFYNYLRQIEKFPISSSDSIPQTFIYFYSITTNQTIIFSFQRSVSVENISLSPITIIYSLTKSLRIYLSYADIEIHNTNSPEEENGDEMQQLYQELEALRRVHTADGENASRGIIIYISTPMKNSFHREEPPWF